MMHKLWIHESLLLHRQLCKLGAKRKLGWTTSSITSTTLIVGAPVCFSRVYL